jgi:hypothetical protein
VISFEVDAEKVINELTRLADGPGGGRFDAIMTTYAARVAERVHILTGRLKASGHMESSWDGHQWDGMIGYLKHPGIFELARGNTPTKNHPEGEHHFFEPVYESQKDYRAEILLWLAEGAG